MQPASTCDGRVIVGSSVGTELFEAAADLVADRAYGLDALPDGVIDLPVEIPLAGEDGAYVAAAHGDEHVSGFGESSLQGMVR